MFTALGHPLQGKRRGTQERGEGEIPLTPMGVLAPGSAHAGPSAQPPIDMSGNFTAHVSAVTIKIFEKNLKKTKNRPQGAMGGGGVKKNFTQIFIIFF